MDPEVEDWLRATQIKASLNSPSKPRSLGFPKVLMGIGLVLSFGALMFYLGYVTGFDTATITNPPCPSDMMNLVPRLRGLVNL